jgi:hypothetical protein
VRKSGALRIGIVLLLGTVAAGVFALAGRADDPAIVPVSSSAQPGFINPNGDVLYNASWQDNDNRTFTHTRVEITIPAGWRLVSSAPSGCTRNGTLVTCEWGTLHFGDVVSQTVRLHSDGDTGTQPISADLFVYEGPGNPGRANHIAALPADTEVLDQALTPDKAGDCVSGNSFGTVVGSGNSETTATGPVTNALCTPITIVERPRTNPTEFCQFDPPIDFTCVNDVVTTDAPQLLTTNPIKLKIIFRQTTSHDLIFTSAGPSSEVQQCTNSNAAAPDPCWYDRKFRQQSATWFVNWSGVDPGWTG